LQDNAGASNNDPGHPQTAYFRNGDDGATTTTCFSRLSSRNRLSPAPLKIKHKTGPSAANAAFCRLISLQLPSSQLDMAEACGSRTQTSHSQLTANDDVAASAKFQLESIGVGVRFEKFRRSFTHFPSLKWTESSAVFLDAVGRGKRGLRVVGREPPFVARCSNQNCMSEVHSRHGATLGRTRQRVRSGGCNS
jgi:hypothetical protein